MSDARKNGVVRWFSNKKGYGFIEGTEGPDLFVHFREIRGEGSYRSLNEGQRVEFSVTSGEKGLQATDVLPLDD